MIRNAAIVSVQGKLAAGALRNGFGRRFLPGPIRRTRAMLSAPDAAVVLEDFCFSPGSHLEALRVKRAGQHCVRVDDQWRICFKRTEQGPAGVEIAGYD
jgi:proteic killer suppression protein